MGSWSEACGFSGMEIGEGEVAYVCLMQRNNGSLNDGAFEHFTPTTTLLRGVYNDYGYLTVKEDDAVLRVFNAQAGLGLANGDDFSIDHLDGRPGVYRWWMHGRAFDFMPTIKPDFPYFSTRRGGYKSTKIKNCGESATMRVAEIRDAYAQGVVEYQRRMASFIGHKDRADLIEAVSCLSKFSLSDIFGYSERRPAYSTSFQEGMTTGVENVEGLLEAYRRNYLHGYAMGELRRTLAPCEGIGPQHGGEQASLQFARFLISAQRERKKSWDD